MTDERWEAQAALYALGALPAEELAEFQGALHGDLKLQMLVAELSDAADAIVAALPRVEPPPALKQRILAAINQQPIAASLEPERVQADSSALPSWLPWVLATGFATLCIILLLLSQSFRQQNVALLQRLATTQERSSQLQTQPDAFARMPMTLLKPATDGPSRALAASTWDSGHQTGILVVEGLPGLASNQTYQVWVYDPKSPVKPIAAGLFNVDDRGTARVQFGPLAERVDEISRVVISTESKGGATMPTKVVLASN